MIVLYFAALYLVATKVIDDLDAFTEKSSRAVDLTSLLVIAVMMLLLAVVQS